MHKVKISGLMATLRPVGQKVALGRRHPLVRCGSAALLIAALCLPAQAQLYPTYRLQSGALIQVAAASNRKPVERSRIAVLDFRSIGIPSAFGDAVAENLRNALIHHQHFTVVERSQIQQAVKEQHFGQSGLVEANQAVALGRMLGAKVIVVGSVTKLAATYTINARFIDVQTGEAIDARSLKTTDDNDIAELVDQMALQLSGKVGDRAVSTGRTSDVRPAGRHGEMVATGKSRWVAGLLSFLIPGLGQYYNGNWGLGLVHTGLWLGGAGVAAGGEPGLGGGLVVTASVWSILDALIATEEETRN